MINNGCNLRCPYCFASQITAEERFNITQPQFDKILEYLLKSNQKIIGIIGGEPLIHPEFDKLLLRFIKRTERLNNVRGLVFTNGIAMDKHWKTLSNEKIALLVNVNDESDVGKVAYEKVVRNIEEAVFEYGMNNQKLTLGLNVYKPDQNLTPFFQLLKRLGHRQCRVSISVPQDRGVNIFDYFRSFIPKIKEMLAMANDINVQLNFDCNLVPYCLMDEEMKALYGKNESLGMGRKYVSTSKCSACSPVMDILPDGSVARCFAMSETNRQNVFDYADIHELAMYYKLTIDYEVMKHPLPECKDCHLLKCQKCYGGCLAFRTSVLEKA